MLLFFQYTSMQIMSWTVICFLWKLNTILVQMFEVLLYLRLNKASYWNTQIFPWTLWLYRGLEYHLCALMLYNSELWASCSCKRNVICRAKSSTVLMEMNDFGMNSSAGYRIDFKGNNAIHLNKDTHEAFRVKLKKKKEKVMTFCWFMCDYTAERCTVAIHGPEPPSRSQRSAADCSVLWKSIDFL